MISMDTFIRGGGYDMYHKTDFHQGVLVTEESL